MKKWGLPLIAALSLVVSMVVSIAGCSSDDDPPVTPPTVDSGPTPVPTTTSTTPPVTTPPNPTGSGATQTKAITNAGGGIAVGNLTVDVPAGALPTATNITVTESSQAVPPPYRAVSPLYIFTPEGLTFNSPVTISIRYTGNTNGLTIYYSRLDDPTKYDPIGTTFTSTAASAQVTHFSSAFIGYVAGFPDAGAACVPTACSASPANGESCNPCSTPCNFEKVLCMCSNNKWACTDKQVPPANDAGADGGEEAGSKGTTDTPTATPPTGNYTTVLDVKLASTTPGAEIYYTVDGTEPTLLSAFYQNDQPIHLVATTTLKFFARKVGLDPSPVVTNQYNISLSAAAPTITPPGGVYNGVQTITLATETQGASIFYTTNGTNPTAQSTLYTGPFQLSQSATVKAIAIKAGIGDSLFGAAGYVIVLPQTAATPTFSPNGGTFAGTTSVTISSTTPGATIYYTGDGSDPTTSSAAVTGPILVSASQTIKAMATKAGFTNSAIGSATFNISTTVSPPTFTPAPGPFTGSILVSMASTTPGAVIRFTTDGSNPTASSAIFSAPVSIAASTTFKAFATKAGLTDSIVTTGAYTLGTVAPSPPTFSPPGGTFATTQTVTISAASGATIYYTTNGTTPTTSSTLGTSVSLSQTTTLSAIAVVNGVSSSVASATYTKTTGTGGSVTPPSISPAGGNFVNSVAITLTATTPGASVLCTTNGTVPTAASQSCSSITLTSSSTVNAISILNGVSSAVATSSYTIQVGKPTFTPTPGSYAGAQSVTISSQTQNVSIYYRIIDPINPGNTTVTDTDVLYVGSPISIATSQQINAFAKKAGLVNSEVAVGAYTIGQAAAAIPSLNPLPGGYSTQQNVVITTSTTNGRIRYTTDGSNPFTSGTAVSSVNNTVTVPTGVSPSTTSIRAYAFKDTPPALANSAEVGGDYVVNNGLVDPPRPDPLQPGGPFPPGTYNGTVTLWLDSATASPDLRIRYTTNGTNPTTTTGTLIDPNVDDAITITSTTVIKAIAYLTTGGAGSSIVTLTYTIAPPQAIGPTFSGPNFPGNFTGSVASPTPGAPALCTTPTSALPCTCDPPNAPGGCTSPTVSGVTLATTETAPAATIRFTSCVLPAPKCTSPTPPLPAGGCTCDGANSPTGCSVANCPDPNASSPAYTGPILISNPGTTGGTITTRIKAITTATGLSASTVTTGDFVVQAQVARPTFTPDDGNYSPASGTQNVAVATTTGSASLFCTKAVGLIPLDPCTAVGFRAGVADGTCTVADTCTTPVAVTATQTVIKAIATRTNFAPSAIKQAQIDLVATNPVPNQVGGVFVNSLANSNVTFTATGATAIRCRVDDGPVVVNPAPVLITDGIDCMSPNNISMTTTKTVQAVAFRTNHDPSGVVTHTYQFKAATPILTPGPGGGGSRTVTATCATTGGIIHYTTDGSAPDSSDPVFPVGGIPINSTIQLFAFCEKQVAGFTDSEIAGGNYTVP